jgi:hypothetical protein
MYRRDFLKSAALAVGLLFGLGATRDDQDVLPRKLIFYVAGGRFYTMKSALKAGDRVDVMRESFKGEVCYGVYNSSGQKIGYVPQGMVPSLDNVRMLDAKVLSARPYAVPWLRYRVSIATVPL